jgi:hypothetical protein
MEAHKPYIHTYCKQFHKTQADLNYLLREKYSGHWKGFEHTLVNLVRAQLVIETFMSVVSIFLYYVQN